LVLKGASVLGDPPKATLGLNNYEQEEAELKKIVLELWGDDLSVKERKVGKGNVFQGVSPEEALERINIKKDFASDKKINWIHRRLGESDFYFVANPNSVSITANCSFRVKNKFPEWWNPETGDITPIEAFSRDSSGTVIPLSFPSSGSGFIVFREKAENEKNRITEVLFNNKSILKNGRSNSPNTSTLHFQSKEAGEEGTYRVVYANGKVSTFTSSLKKSAVTGSWIVDFPETRVPAKVVFDRLHSWSSHSNPEIKYYSGKAVYRKSILLPSLPVNKNEKLYLDLGDVQVVAKVRLNHQDVGILWKPPYCIDITSLAKKGENELEIEVVNLWPNRMIGDENLPEDSERNKDGTLKAWPRWLLEGEDSPTGRTTFTTWRLWKKEDKLRSSGMLGPVTLQVLTSLECE
jgi:hypothetical protein